MKMRRLKRALLLFFGMLAIGYLVLLITFQGHELPMDTQNLNAEHPRTIAIFGATGTIGDGLLKAAMGDPEVDKIHVITRRPSARIEEGV